MSMKSCVSGERVPKIEAQASQALAAERIIHIGIRQGTLRPQAWQARSRNSCSVSGCSSPTW